jgi:hypothetical protein
MVKKLLTDVLQDGEIKILQNIERILRYRFILFRGMG